MAPLASAANYTWGKTDATGNWNTTDLNWYIDGGTVLSPWTNGAHAAIFGDAPASSNRTIAIAASINASSITINNTVAPAYTSGVTTNGWIFNYATGSLTGTGTLTKTGAGWMTLAIADTNANGVASSTAANTYSGGTFINGGVLSLGLGGAGTNVTATASALGTGLVTVQSGGMLHLWFTTTSTFETNFANQIKLDNGIILNRDGLTRLTGNIEVASGGASFRSKWAGKNLIVAGQISGSGLITLERDTTAGGQAGEAGTTIILAGDNYAHTGGVTWASGGNVTIQHVNALGTGTFTVNTAGTFNASSLATGSIITNKIALGNVSGTIIFTSKSGAGNNLTLSGVISGGGSGTTFQSNTASGDDKGTLILSGDNTFTAASITINQGSLRIANANALGAATNTVKFDSGGIATLSFAGSYTIPQNINITFAAKQIDTEANTVTLTGALGGTFPISKIGTGTLILAGANTWSNTLTITAGPVQIGNGGTTGTMGTGGISIPTGQSLLFNRNGSLTLDGTITGVGDIKLQGTSTLNINSGIDTFSGFTGKLTAEAGTSLGGNLVMSSGEAIINGTLQPGGATTAGSMSFNKLTVTDRVVFDLNAASSSTGNDLVSVSDVLTINNGAKIGLTFSGVTPENVTTRTYTLFSANSISTDVGDFTSLLDASWNEGRASYSVQKSASAIRLVVTGAAANLVWAGSVSGTDNYNWISSSNTSPTGPQNWLNGNTPDRFYAQDNVTFDDTGKAGTILINGAVKPGTWAINNSAGHDYIFASANNTPDADLVGGTGGLVKSGTGKMTILTNNTFTGTVTINDGTVQVGDGTKTGKLGGTGTITVAPTATLVYKLPDTGTYSLETLLGGTRLITGGTFVKEGTGTMTIAKNTNTLAGQTTTIVKEGTLEILADTGIGATGALRGTLTIDGATAKVVSSTANGLGWNGTDVKVNVLNILNGGTFTHTATGDSGWGIAYHLTGSKMETTHADGRFSFGGGTSVHTHAAATSSVIAGRIKLRDNQITFTVEDGAASEDLQVSAEISPEAASVTAGITKEGAGTMVLSGALSYTGPTNVNAGTLKVTSATNTTSGGWAVKSGSNLWMATATSRLAELKLEGGAVLSLSQGTTFGDMTSLGTLTLDGAAKTSTLGHLKSMSSPPAYDVIGSLSLSNGHTLSAGDPANVEVLSVAKTLALNSNTLVFTIKGTGSGAYDSITTGSMTINGTNPLNIILPNGVITNGTYTLVTLTEGSLTPGALSSITTSLGLGESVYVTPDGKQIVLNVTNGNSSLTWNGNEVSNIWNVAADNTNWNTSSNPPTPAAFKQGDAVTFEGSGSQNVRIGAEVKPTLVTVLGGNYIFTNESGGRIAGTASMRVQNATLTISGANSFTGIVEINGGTVELTGATTLLGNGGAASALGGGLAGASNLVIDGGTLRFNSTASTAASNETNRSFTIGQGGATLEVASQMVRFNATSAIEHSGTGDRDLILTGASGSSSIASGGGVNGGVLILSLTDPTDGKLRVVKTGGGIWVLQSSTSTYSGGTEIYSGMISVTSDRAFGAVPTQFDAQNIILDGGYIGNMTSSSTAIFSTGSFPTLNANRGIYIGQGDGGIRIGYTGVFTIAGGISGPGGLTKVDGGTLALTGVNTFRGGLTINSGGGTVQVGNSEAIPHGVGTGAVTLTSGTTLALMNVNAYIPELAESGTGIIQNGTGSTATTLFLGDNNSSFTFKGQINNNVGTLGLTKLGTGDIRLELNSATYSGPVVVEDGRLELAKADSFGGTTSYTVKKGTLDIYGTSLDANKTVTIAGDGYSLINPETQQPALQGALATSGTGTEVTVAKIILSDSATIGSSGKFNFGTITGTGNLTLNEIDVKGGGDGNANYILPAAGRITLTATADDPGQLIVATKLTANNSANDAIKAEGGVAINAGGNLILNASSGIDHIISISNAVTLKAGGLLSLSGNTTQVLQTLTGDMSGAGTVTHTGSTSNSGTLIIDNTTAVSFSGRIGSNDVAAETGSERVNLTKRGTGTFTLSNSNSDYTGTTRVSGGVLELAAILTNTDTLTTGVLGSTSTTAASSLALDGGILRDTSTELSYTNKLFTIALGGATIESSGTNDSGGLQFLNTGAIAFESAVVNATFTLGGSKNFSDPNLPGVNKFSSAITDNGNTGGITTLRKTGSGMWVLDGTNNTYTGNTLIQQGTLAIQADNAISSVGQVVLGDAANSGTLYLNGHKQTVSGLSTSGTGTDNSVIGGNSVLATLTVNNAANNTFGGAMGGTANNANNFQLVKTGAGTLTLSGALTYTGNTAVKTGTLALTGASTSIASTYTLVADGAKLDVSTLANGITISTDKFLAAGNSTASDALIGKYTLAGGTLHIGDTGLDSNGNVVLSESTAATLQINGSLSSVSGIDSTIKYTFSENATGANDLISAGTLNFQGNTIIDPYLSGGRLQEGTYTLFKYTTFSAGSLANLSTSLLNSDSRYEVVLRNDTGTNSIVMDVQRKGGTSNTLYWLGSPNTQWGDPASTGANFWIDGAVGNVSYSAGDHAVFDDRVTNAAQRNITVAAGGIVLGSATFENSTGHDYTISGGIISGTGTIEKYGTGKLTITNANTYSGGTFLGGGPLVVG
ncbi:MAG: autotransporter-associated beta strand repeat-containing protein, partial [Puniceicoccales bacterium]|nr:autotransporter-associated beta strand repeat-containing protein [Puniceicoccales bacterium]